MEKSSFFNSVSHDRTYKAEDWAEYFASFIGFQPTRPLRGATAKVYKSLCIFLR